MEPPGHHCCLFGPGVGSGYAKDPYGEVHLKELIRLQITIYIYIYTLTVLSSISVPVDCSYNED